MQLLIDKGADIKAEDKVRTRELALRERRPNYRWSGAHILAVIAYATGCYCITLLGKRSNVLIVWCIESLAVKIL